MKAMTGTLAGGIVALLTHWELYGMIATGVLGMFLLQSAMNAGRLLAAQPGLTLVRPDRVGPVGRAGLRQVGPDRLVRRAGRPVSTPVLAAAVLVLICSLQLSDEAAAGEEDEPAAQQSTARSARRQAAWPCCTPSPPWPGCSP